MANHGLLEPFDQPLPVRIIADDLLPRISPCHHVIDGALKFDPKSSWHVGSLKTAVELTVKPQTKNKVWHCAKKLGKGESSQNVKPFIETLRVTNPVRQSRASSRKRVLRGGGQPSPRSVVGGTRISRCAP
jgi:hypothetical protein